MLVDPLHSHIEPLREVGTCLHHGRHGGVESGPDFTPNHLDWVEGLAALRILFKELNIFVLKGLSRVI